MPTVSETSNIKIFTSHVKMVIESEREKAFDWMTKETSAVNKLPDGLWYVTSSKFEFPIMQASHNLLYTIGKVMAMEAEIDAEESLPDLPEDFKIYSNL